MATSIGLLGVVLPPQMGWLRDIHNHDAQIDKLQSKYIELEKIIREIKGRSEGK